MKNFRIFALLLSLFMTMAFSTIAFSASVSQNTETLLGTWNGQTTILLDTGENIIEAPRLQSIVITEAKENLIQGYRTWSAIEANQPGYVGSVPEDSAQEPFIGIILSNGKSIRMVETEDSGLMFCEIISPDKIEMTYMEAAPHAVIYTTVYERLK